jgi:hypothetical protein
VDEAAVGVERDAADAALGDCDRYRSVWRALPDAAVEYVAEVEVPFGIYACQFSAEAIAELDLRV